MTEVLRKKVRFYGKENIVFHPERESVLSAVVPPSISTDYIETCDGELKREKMGIRATGSIWTEKRDGNVGLILAFFQLLSDKTLMMLKSTVLLAHAIQSMFLTVFAGQKQLMIWN